MQPTCLSLLKNHDHCLLNAQLSPKAAADKSAYAEFRFSDDEVYMTKLSDAVDNGNGTYTFSCSINPIDIDREFKAVIRYSDNTTGSELTYSARQYFNKLLSANILDEASIKFICSLINFSERLNEYSGRPVADENNITLSEDHTVGDEYKAVTRKSGSELKASFSSININERLNLIIKFTLEDGKSISDYRFTVNGKTVSAVQEDNIASITLTKVSPDMYSKMYTFRAEAVSDPSVYAEVDYSAFSYARLVMEKSSDEKLINTMKALVIYGKAANNL